MVDQIIRPNGFGSYNQLLYQTYGITGLYHWQSVSNQIDEGPGYATSDERTSAYYMDTYNLQEPTRIGHITNVRVYTRCQSRSQGYSKTVIYNGSSVQYGTERYRSYGWYNFYTDYAVNPWTGLNWTWDQLDSLQAGVALKAGANSYSECSEVWVVITSVPSAGQVRVIGMMM